MEIQKAGDDSSAYKNEIKEGVQIFDKSFKEMKETKNFPQKKQEFNNAMQESLKAIQDAATALANKELLKKKQQLDQDYQAYLQTPNSENEKKVEKDIDSLRDST